MMTRFCKLFTNASLHILLILCLLLSGAKAWANDPHVIKVLAVGNSFSMDAIEQHLYELAEAQGVKLIIGNGYIPGCTIDTHWANAQTGKAAYSYRKIVDGQKVTHDKTTLQQMIADEDWDIITVQQASHESGFVRCYSNLSHLIDYLHQTARNREVRIPFHMTWAYAQNCTYKYFKDYGSSQAKMYHAICTTVDTVMKQCQIEEIIPAGIAVQAARKTLGDRLNRDGFHLAHELGRYLAACVWCEFLTGQSVVGNRYHPQDLTPTEVQKVQTAAHRAFKNTRRKLRNATF